MSKGPFAGMSRRDFLARCAAAGGTAVMASWAGPVIERAYAADPAGMGSFDDIEHIVLLMNENRSFDHYFGSLSGVRGFDDPSNAWRQYGYQPGKGPDPNGYVEPFRLDTNRGPALDGECINDPTHAWGPQHRCWRGGAMDRWIPEHIAEDGPVNGPATMGYYTRADLPAHYDLADAFTICDNYFCSVMGPTDPNRLYWVSATIDPEAQHGGPLVRTPYLIPQNAYSWRTMPENLEEAGVSWKIYNNKDLGPVSSVLLDGMMGCFTQASDPNSALARKGKDPVYPDGFREDVANDTLPSVSWLVPRLLDCEHPALPPALGATGLLMALDILTSNPAVWEKTALIVSYDENGGFFDHVAPPTPPPGTPGEFLADPGSVEDADGIAGPVGLGFRVPSLVLSPYSRGGLVASETFDHTSQLRLIERRFGVDVPNLTPWRRATCGDMTSAFNFAGKPDASVPSMADAQARVGPAIAQCGGSMGLGFLGMGQSYPVPPNSMPSQEPGMRAAPSGL